MQRVCNQNIALKSVFMFKVIKTVFVSLMCFLSPDPTYHVLPWGVQGGVDVPRGDLHAPGEHNLQDIPGPRRDCRDQEICR